MSTRVFTINIAHGIYWPVKIAVTKRMPKNKLNVAEIMFKQVMIDCVH